MIDIAIDTKKTDFTRKRHDSPGWRSWRRFRKNVPATIGLGLLALMLLICAAAPYLTSYSPTKQNLSQSLQPPSKEHIFGTDYLGRDILTRILYGGRLSLTIGYLAVALGLIVGVPLGVMAGYFGSAFDLIVSRFADILLSFPSFLLALILVALMGVDTRNIIISVGILAIPSFIRLSRASVLIVREQEFILSAQAMGGSSPYVIWKHVLPNTLTPLIINASMNLGYAITTAAGLGFLGLGVQPPTPEWGMMLGEAKNYVFSHPYMITFPGLVIFLTIVSLNLVGDALRDALDPRLKNAVA